MAAVMTRYASLGAWMGGTLLVVAGCEGPPATVSYSGSTMGTSYDVLVEVAGRVADTTGIGALVTEELTYLERVLSTYDSSSDVSRFGADGGTDPMSVDASLLEVLALALEVAERSAGAFDPTVGPLVDAWGFGPVDAPWPDSADVRSLAQHVGYQRLQPDPAAGELAKSDARVRIDLSGIAKGFAAERIAVRLEQRGHESALVDVGGELRVLGSHADGRPWRVALEGPGETAPELLGTIGLVDEGVATSGDFRNYYESDGVSYTHIIDPRTGFPVPYRGFSVSVVHRDAAMADAWATALTVLGPEEGLALARREGVAALFAWRTPEGLRTVATPEMSGRVTPVE